MNYIRASALIRLCKFTSSRQFARSSHRLTGLSQRRSVTLVKSELFHTSRPNRALPPLFWIIVRPLLKIGSIIFGRGLRKWWQSLPPDKKLHVLNYLKGKKYTILGSCAVAVGISGSYYYLHLEEDPMTKRKKFIIFSRDQLIQLTNMEIAMKAEEFKDEILPANHPTYKYVERIVSRLLAGNKDLDKVSNNKWTITVIDSPLVEAFVFPNGHIFVFDGIIKACSNEDQLGSILGHEMAHAILGHVGEKLSNTHIVELLFIIPLTILWTIFPDKAAFIFQLITGYLKDLLIELPYSRSLETEADEIGLQLAAKACFDVREAYAFWYKMSKVDPNENIEFLSTHPSHESRKVFIEKMIPAAITLRKLCKCPDLRNW